ncbi:MAG: MFS transporter [Pseudomonas sp.]
MDALLILGGLLLILVGLVWLVMLAFDTSLLWGLGSLLPPMTLAFVLRHWRVARKAVVLGGLGFIPLVVGLTLLANQDYQRLQAILSFDWARPAVQAPTELAINLRGKLNGQPFAPQQGELIDGVLTLREGEDVFARREVTIRMPNLATSGNAPVRVDVLPQDAGNQPEVQLSWLLPEQELPEARRLNHAYTLHLKLDPQGPNKLAGDFHLVLPPQFKTTLSGTVEVFTNHLRYVDDKVDTRYDSRETLEYVIGDYLKRRFATSQVDVGILPAVDFPATTLNLEVEARINDQRQQLPVVLRKSPGRGWVVVGDRYQVGEKDKAPAKAEKPAVADATPAPASSLDRRLRFSLERLQNNPNRYQNLKMRILTERGSMVEGRFNGIDTEGQIVVQRNVNGQGGASFAVVPGQITSIELLEP